MGSATAFDRAIEFARDLIRIPGPPGGEGAVAERVRQELVALGFHDVWIDDAGNVCGVIRGRGEAPSVMLSCHLDVVDAGDVASWEHAPYGADVADGFLHGRGAMDIKGPLALQTHAAARFVDDPPPGDVIVAHTVLEERGGWGMAHLLESGGVEPGAVIIGESTGGDVCIGHRGRAELVVELRGLAGHASAPDRARNAIDLLESVLPALREFADRLPSDSVLGRSTAVATGIETSPTSPNVIPDSARVTVDWRILPTMSGDGVVAMLREYLASRVDVGDGRELHVDFATERQRTYTGLERQRRLFTPGFLLPADHRIALAAATSVAASSGREPRVRPWAFATDGGHTCGEHGIPTIGFAPGEERHAHTNTERLDLDAARVAFDAYPDLITSIMRASS